MNNVRKLVFSSLRSCAESDRYTNLEADSVIKREGLTGNDKDFYTALLYGVTEREVTLEYIIEVLTGKSIGKLQINVQLLLKIGLYQIIYMDSVPDYAAVGETVKLAKKLVNRGAVGMINAVLRECVRRTDGKSCRQNEFLPEKKDSVVRYLSVKYSVPQYLCKRLICDYGEETTERIFSSFFEKKYLSLKVNLLRTTREDFAKRLHENGYKIISSDICDAGITVENSGSVTAISGYDEGLFFIQDDSSYAAVTALGPEENDLLLDACACPGGKSFASAIMMKNKGKIISCDLHGSKLSLVKSGAERLGIDIIETLECDSGQNNTEFSEKFDKVICDVPCSGVGIIGKKPDLRYKKPQDIESLPDVQRKILANCSRYVKKGGKLMYSTCTLLKSENEEVVAEFIAGNPEFRLESERTFLPFEGQTDGFYYAVMKKEF